MYIEEIKVAVAKGKAADVKNLVETALAEGAKPEDVLNNAMLVAMDDIGSRFQKNEVFIPEVMLAAKAMNAGMELLKPHMPHESAAPIGKAVIGTVKGDMHDIGKNLVGIMMEGRGIEVIDLGVNVPADKFVDAVKKHGAKIAACSALLTTTMPEMQRVVEGLKAAGLRESVKVMVGGAPVTQEYCEKIGADIYAADAATAAMLAKEVFVKWK